MNFHLDICLMLPLIFVIFAKLTNYLLMAQWIARIQRVKNPGGVDHLFILRQVTTWQTAAPFLVWQALLATGIT